MCLCVFVEVTHTHTTPTPTTPNTSSNGLLRMATWLPRRAQTDTMQVQGGTCIIREKIPIRKWIENTEMRRDSEKVQDKKKKKERETVLRQMWVNITKLWRCSPSSSLLKAAVLSARARIWSRRRRTLFWRGWGDAPLGGFWNCMPTSISSRPI